ncbi:PASTA domain-containing protein [Rhodococcus sp. Q]|uniref:PASTA domain-containing protein n=1 Tax=Rhodococcus sp. Q TaxID=2502252 RepID=UPI002015EDBC|nr:PASTA domain-containing protein [Rhodococcus sp. Q]
MKKVIVAATLALSALALTACGADEKAATPPETVTVEVPAPAPETKTETVAQPAPSAQAAEAAPVMVPMPDVTCMNLQAAQDRIQAAGVFFSQSTDATGAGRAQVMDRNWVVVSQSPAAGVPVGEGDAMLSVVKIGEPGDCS